VFFVMALIDGDNLAQRIHKRGAMDPDEARRVLRNVADALAYAHSQKVIHRDIKPDNILLDAASGRPMVTDFGIARAISEGADTRLTATGIAIGTPAYMSPEQSAGDKEIDGRSDLYSLGVVAYQMLTGELPFIASSTPAMLVKHLSERPTPVQVKRAGVPADLAAAVMCMLEKNPADRFDSAADLVKALDGAGVIPRPRTPPPLASNAWSPLPDDARYQVSPEQSSRWNAPAVDEFRRKLKPYLVVNGFLLVLGIFTGADMFAPVAAIWGVILAFKYAKLWSEGYDWRDVFRQPRDRMFFDVLAEMADSFRAIWDPRKRTEVRERERIRGQRGSGLFDRSNTPGAVPRLSGSPNDLSSIVGQHARAVSEAARNRDDVLRMIETLPKRDRELLSDIPASASALYQKVESLAVSLAELERNAPPESSQAVDQEIVRLEGEANPLDVVASDERVRRLAFLKRQRRAIADISGRTSVQREKLESCAIALQNMRLDIVRLKSGPQTSEHITSVAEKAIALAREVDTAMYVKEEMSKLDRGRTGSARR
jgi:serine/threonine-protein kinase